MACFFLVGCGSKEAIDDVQNTENTQKQTQETEASHTHEYIEEITVEVTCEADGEKTFTCECGDSYTEVIAATGHNYEEVADSAVAATCAADGKEADKKCTLCESVIEGAAIAATAHTYGAYVYNNDATTTADGTESATCSGCGGKTSRTAPGTMMVFPYPLNTLMYNGEYEIYFYFYFGDDATKSALADQAFNILWAKAIELNVPCTVSNSNITDPNGIAYLYKDIGVITTVLTFLPQ